MPDDVNCIFTKVLIPFLEREVGLGARGTAEICRVAGRPRDYLMTDHNWLPLPLADRLIRTAMTLAGDHDEEAFIRRMWEFGMDWKPREERSYLGTYSMGIGDPRTLYQRMDVLMPQIIRCQRFETVEIGRAHARYRFTPVHDARIPRWLCDYKIVQFERFPTNWGLPRARVTEPECAARGAAACVFDVRWRNPSLGRPFWVAAAAGATGAAALALTLASRLPWGVDGLVAGLPLLAGIALGYGLRERQRRRHTQRLLDLQSEEIIYSNNELEKKFRDLEAKIEQLSLLIDLSAAVNATLDPEKIYGQALQRLVHRMGYQAAHLFLVDDERGMVRGHLIETADPAARDYFAGLALPLDPQVSAIARVAATGLPLLENDVATAAVPLHAPTARALGLSSFVAVPLRVKERVLGVLAVGAGEAGRFDDGDLELLSAVANNVALAIDKAASFQTIEDLTRGLEDKVRVRTEQLRIANEELQTAYRDLQATQMQLIQREKMASVGQLVAGVAHELNNPIGFVFSNVTTLEDFVRRLRAILETYRAVDLPPAAREHVAARWQALKIDYALKYLDSMTQGIREGAERARKIVRDLRVFARSEEDVWQPVDLHEELESSLTLLNHLLKDRVKIERRYGTVPSVECVRSQIDQVFLNLLANAAQAIAGEGSITIETRADGGMAVVTIADTGSGIPPEIVGRIFDPFFTTKPVGEGTGLGLSISYELIKKHHGEVTAASQPGAGAVFTVRLPIARAERPA
jgi:signal transduction histidine kinase